MFLTPPTSSAAIPISSSLPGVKLLLDQGESLNLNKRNSTTVWNLFLSSDFFLNGIRMLEVENLHHFQISNVRTERSTSMNEMPFNMNNGIFHDPGGGFKEGLDRKYKYRLTLTFTTNVFGIFKQTLIFDFGFQPFLAKKVCVTVAPESFEDDLISTRESILRSTQVWDDTNCSLIKFSPPSDFTDMKDQLLCDTYPFPHQSCNLTKVCFEENLTPQNYKERFHQLLYMEEYSQYQELNGFEASLEVVTTERYLMFGSGCASGSTAKYTRPGELFGRIELNLELSDDSKAGSLILTKCSSVLLKVDRNAVEDSSALDHSEVWECLIEDTLRSVIYVRMSADFVKKCGLKKDMRLKGNLQFRLNRLSLVEMHYAVDRLLHPELVYPAMNGLPLSVPWSPNMQWGDSLLHPELNVKQKEAVLAITTPLRIALPPILIIGPYGTGKTYTVGASIKLLLQDDVSKILVCTHSNSAADLYIKDYIDPFIRKNRIRKKVLRVYYKKRWVQTVHPAVQRYCLIHSDENTRSFYDPSLTDIMDADLVVATLSTSRIIAQMLVPGHFTHIILDEAAQALETEAIIPLTLATNETRIVLAGDHMQMEPEIVSEFAIEKKLNLSLLERLYIHYPPDHPCKILLSENYRSHKEIVAFTSQLFYEQKLLSSGKQPAHPKWFPLTFFTAKGEETQEENSTSFYNNYEVAEIVDRLQELVTEWPEIWGNQKVEIDVGVITSYHDQVLRIRSELRRKRLDNISVERVQNVQGKQYRVIFISIVRTRKTCVDNSISKRTDFGFLSSAKLLNTALTRAQSLVAVVGDPVTLCSIGKCRIIWRRFLEVCNERGSLFGYTWSELEENLGAIELKNIYGLNPLAKEFIPRGPMLAQNNAASFMRHRPPPPPVPMMNRFPQGWHPASMIPSYPWSYPPFLRTRGYPNMTMRLPPPAALPPLPPVAPPKPPISPAVPAVEIEDLRSILESARISSESPVIQQNQQQIARQRENIISKPQITSNPWASLTTSNDEEDTLTRIRNLGTLGFQNQS